MSSRIPHLVKRGSIYYYRRQERKKDRWISLRTSSFKKAKGIVDEIHLREVLAGAGYGEAPRLNQRMPELGNVLEFYAKAGCPKLDGRKREGKSLQLEVIAISNLKRLLGGKDPRTLPPADWQRYQDKRLNEYEAGKGARTVELEWTTLNSAFRWAIRYQDETEITSRSLTERPQRARASADVVHCREYQPEDANELHSLARYFFEIAETKSRGSCVFGWQTLLATMIGQGSSELLKLRTDAKNRMQPGFDDGKHLWLYRSKTHKGTAPFIEIGPELREALTAHAAWRAQRFPDNPWFFPSPRDAGQSIASQSLGHAMRAASEALGIPQRKPHGLRSYYVNVLRSKGISDSEIALRIGHKTGGKLISLRLMGRFYQLRWGGCRMRSRLGSLGRICRFQHRVSGEIAPEVHISSLNAI